jgi:hypothetical protein
MLFYLKANVTMRVAGISGPFVRTVSWLVNAENPDHAKFKYETQVKKDFAHMQLSHIEFEYTEFAGEIK